VEFEEYVAARGQTLLRLAHVLTGDVHSVEDLTQSALADAYRHWRRVVRADHPDAYVRRILVNQHLSWRRRRSSTESPRSEVDDGRHAPDPAEAVVDRDEGRHLLDGLAPRARTVLALRYYADLDDRGIAELMGVSESAVRSTASRALATLRERHPDLAPHVEESR
jgi:RNA polymerase sigma-70 factor (sigma-E family)